MSTTGLDSKSDILAKTTPLEPNSLLPIICVVSNLIILVMQGWSHNYKSSKMTSHKGCS